MTERHSTLLVVGGGIGGLATAVAASAAGIDVRVLEQAAQFDEVGAGLQMGPNAVRMLDRLGLLDAALASAVRPARARLLDAMTGQTLTTLELGAACEARYGYPYVVMHRQDLLAVLQDACERSPLVTLETGRLVESVTPEIGRAVALSAGWRYTGSALIGADGLHSTVRKLFDTSEPDCGGYVAYRGTIAADDTTSVHGDDVLIWIGPGLHLVQYPIRSGGLYNQVAVFASDSYLTGDPDWGNEAELDERFERTCAPVRQAVRRIPRHRRWPVYDRAPLGQWTLGTVALLGDAAHPMQQYLGQGACQALEDAVALAAQIAASRNDVPLALKRYEQQRLPRASRCQLAARPWGTVWHSEDPVVIGLRDRLLERRAADDYQDLDWLYAEEVSPAAPSAVSGGKAEQ